MKDRVTVRQQINEKERQRIVRIQNEKATIINTIARGFLAKKRVKEIKLMNKKNKLSTKIQSVIRMYYYNIYYYYFILNRKLAKINAKRLRQCYQVIQTFCRHFVDKIHLRKRFLKRREILDNMDAEKKRLAELERQRIERQKRLKNVFTINHYYYYIN